MSLKVRFSIPSELKNKGRCKRKRRCERQSWLCVDVGTSKDFVVRLGKGVSYDIIHSSESSVLARLIEANEYTDVVVVRWGLAYEAALDRDHISSTIASDIVSVPECKGKSFHVFKGKHVSVSVRTYIPGVPLSSVIERMNAEELDHVKLQVSAVVASLASKTSPTFGGVRQAKFKTNSAEAFLTRCVVTEKLSGNPNTACLLPTVLDDANEVPAVLCHRQLTPEHVIIDGVSVVGVVGWSSADYVPEAVDRTMYEYSSPKRKFLDWYRYLTNLPYTYSSSEPSNVFLHNVREYCKMVHVQANRRSPTSINSTAGYGSTHFSPGVKHETSNVNCGSDGASLESLLNNTVDTWEKSTTTTCI